MIFLRNGLTPIAQCFLCALALQSGGALAQGKMTPEDEAIYKAMVKNLGMDPNMATAAVKTNDSARQWAEGKDGIVDYHIVGAYHGQTNVSADSNWIAYADVTDGVVIDLKWKLSESKLVGTPIFRNSKSDVRNPRNWEPKCQPPVLRGEYEHYELQGIRQGLGGALEVTTQTNYPVVEVVQSCSGAHKSIPAARKTHTEEMVVPSPVMLTMALPASDNLRVSADKKSLIQTKAGWTWTFTPSVKK